MRCKEVWLVARLGPRVDELARSLRAAFAVCNRCWVLLLDGHACHRLCFTLDDLDGVISEADVLDRVRLKVASSDASTVESAASDLGLSTASRVVFLDEDATEDWSWAAPDLESVTVCFGVHEDFVEEITTVRKFVGSDRSCAIRLGPVALHSSACLHLLASVRQGRPQVPTPFVRPAVVQRGSAPRAISARSFRRALPRRQPIRFFVGLTEPPLSTAATRAEVHQAIVASCLVSKSVYDERDTRLTFVWPEKSGLRAITLDRSLLSRSETKVLPAESSVLEAVQEELSLREAPFDTVLDELLSECAILSFAKPVVARVVHGDVSTWPEWSVQASWPTDPPIFLFLRWCGDLPFSDVCSVAIPPGCTAKSLVILQHWHTLGILPALLTPRSNVSCCDASDILEEVRSLVPLPGQDVQASKMISVQGAITGRVRNGHVLFAEFGPCKAMCKDVRLGPHYAVLINELHVGDVLHCSGYPGYDFKGEPTIFVHHVNGIEPKQYEEHHQDYEVIYNDSEIHVAMKPSGMLAHEDARHRHERGTALKVEAAHLILSPEVDVSGPAVYAWRELAKPARVRLTYLVLVDGAPDVSMCSAALRPKQGQPHEPAETRLVTLWKGPDCSLVEAVVDGVEQPAQVRRHMHILGFPIWGDRRFGNRRGTLRCRAVYGLAKPWCHLARIEVAGPWSLTCECKPPQDLLRVLGAVGCPMQLPSSVCRRTSDLKAGLEDQEYCRSIRAYMHRSRLTHWSRERTAH
eukprot:TRINITY_DN54969_c0_g1_i1.p1 TRINITY_DN54969_c0_g1~~TRINITY_DN54969_c0_g1_i1.p1  ORF type:complete len:750 (-),score=60.97 TRINITY_DN54969_c0_g1_i1:227-2476(-)